MKSYIYRCLSALELKKLLYNYDLINKFYNGIGFSFSLNKQVAIKWFNKVKELHENSDMAFNNYIITVDTTFLKRKPIKAYYNFAYFEKHPKVFEHIFSMPYKDFLENIEAGNLVFEEYVESFELEEEVIVQNDNYKMIDGLIVEIETNNKELLSDIEDTYYTQYSSPCNFNLIDF
jgi:hypothetical protein